MKKYVVVQLAAKEIGLNLQNNDSSQQMNQFVQKINELLVNDFNKLIALLYRMDVSETKLKILLKENPNEDAGKIIAQLMIERQAQKIKSRQQFNRRDKNIDEKDKW